MSPPSGSWPAFAIRWCRPNPVRCRSPRRSARSACRATPAAPTRRSTAPRKPSTWRSAAAPDRFRCGARMSNARPRANIGCPAERAPARNERRIVMAFEPVVEAHSRNASFYECLVRMEQDDGQVLLAPDIVPVAEKLGLIRLVDHRVLGLAVAELAASPDVR